MDGKHLLIFDFDGVLRNVAQEKSAVPYPNIAKDIPAIFESGDYVLAVASFNPRAELFLTRWGLASYFASFRCGSNQKRDELASSHCLGYSSFSRSPWECDDGVTKPLQIRSMLDNELSSFSWKSVTFFDDCMSNITEVMREFSRRTQRKRERGQKDRGSPIKKSEQVRIECVFIDAREGFQLDKLPMPCLC